LTTYEITTGDGIAQRVEADWHRYTADDDKTRLYRNRRILWRKRVLTTRPGATVKAIVHER
jgi:hypothetical protein